MFNNVREKNPALPCGVPGVLFQTAAFIFINSGIENKRGNIRRIDEGYDVAFFVVIYIQTRKLEVMRYKFIVIF